MKKIYLVVFIVGVVTAIYSYSYKENNLSVSEIKWGYSQDVFKVSFLISNNSKHVMSNKILIRAFKDKYLGKAIVTDLVGEKRITTSLTCPSEKRYLSIITGVT